jgi:GTPase SAR1 family protein
MDFPSQVYKTLLVGDQGSRVYYQTGVGKSSLLLHYTTGEFKADYTVTIGLEFGSKPVEIDPETNVTL